LILKSTLEQAAQENIIAAEQIEPLFQFIQNQKTDALPDPLLGGGEQPIKFVRSFGDMFITLGIVLLVVAINLANLPGYYYLIPAAGFVGLAEWLVRVRRLALPGIAILISIIFFVSKAIPFGNENAMILGFSALSLTSLLFYIRYKMPFSLLPFSLGLVALPVAMIGLSVFETPALFVSLGLLIFVAALWFDSQDTKRLTHLSDNAFWLYLLASPLIVHGVMISLFMSNETWIHSMNIEILMIIFFVVFFLLSLLIDRRVMLISTQLYMIYALTQLLQNNDNNTQDTMIYILVGLGLFVIYFGTYWYKSRRLVFGFLSGSVVSRYIPDLDTSDVKPSDVKQ